MAFDWKEFLALADYLLEGRDDRVSRECLQRAAVSRAYYAFFVPFVTDLLGEQILREQEQLQTMLR